jgi:hypothetical protein
MSKIMHAPSDGRAFTDYMTHSARHALIKDALGITDERAFREFLHRHSPDEFHRLLRGVLGPSAKTFKRRWSKRRY